MRSAIALATLLLFASRSARADERPVSTEKTEKRASYVAATWTFTILGASAIGTSIGLGLYAKHEYDRAFEDGSCENQPSISSRLCDASGYAVTKRAVTMGNVATVVGVGGIGLVATAAIVYWQAPRDRVSVVPTVTTDGGSLVVAGSF